MKWNHRGTVFARSGSRRLDATCHSVPSRDRRIKDEVVDGALAEDIEMLINAEDKRMEMLASHVMSCHALVPVRIGAIPVNLWLSD